MKLGKCMGWDEWELPKTDMSGSALERSSSSSG